MQRNKSITRYKQKVLIFLSALFIALILQPKQTVYAEVDWAAWASSLVHSDGTGGGGGNTTIQNGVTYTRTGYLAYLLTADGAPVPGTQAVAFSSPGFEYLSGYSWYCTSRKGGYTATSFNGGTAPWGCTPWTPSGSGTTVSCSTNEPQIKAWFENMNGGFQNGSTFVWRNWGEDALVHYMNNDYIIVIETLMHFQYSKPGNAISRSELSNMAIRIVNQKYSDDDLYTAAVGRGYKMTDANTMAGAITYIKGKLVDAMIEQLEKTMDTSTRVFVGPPVIGTVPNLLNFKASIGLSTNPFKSYTNKVAPFAEHAIADGVAERAGFNVWTGSTSSELSDADVQNYAVAMMIITANTTAQTTCDEPLQPAPHRPPVESEGTYTIVKNYRTLLEDGVTYQEDGCHSQGDLGSNILIENELEYQVVGWKITNTTNTGISSIDWNPPGSQQAEGKSPGSVTIEQTYTCLYVLLEKVESEPLEEEDYNYLLSESSITRTVWFSNPDHNKLGNMNNPEWIYDHKFNWASPATPYCEGHPYKGACTGLHEGEHTSSCPKGCPSTCNLPSPHIHEEACDSHHYWNCGSNDCDLNNQTAKCSGTPEWVDKTLELTITNTKQNSYPDILATKEGWNAEVLKGGVEKRFYDNGQIERKQFSLEPHDKESEITNWDYVCVLLRGKDKLTVAEWQNNGEGNNEGNA